MEQEDDIMSNFAYDRRKRKRLKPAYVFMASLLATLFIAGCFLCYSSKQEYRVKLERVKIYGNYFSQKTKLTFENFAQSLHILSRVITWQNGKTDLYQEIAEHLIQIIPETLNINLAKNGIVSHVYPYERNKNALGHNLLLSKTRKEEARLAITTRKVTISGPFKLVQGGTGLAFRQAVFLPKTNAETIPNTEHLTDDEYFWGFVLITYDFPKILERLKYDELSLAGFSWNLWRFSPSTGKKETIISSETQLNKNTETFEIPIQNATWYLDISPKSGWLDRKNLFFEITVYSIICILLSLLLTIVIILKTKNKIIERQSRTDSLTNLPNRNWTYKLLQEALIKHQNSAYRNDEPILYLCMLDFNDFKHINDTYGHHTGDKLLIEFAKRISRCLLPEEFAARLGGDEFLAIFYCKKPDDDSMPTRLQGIQNYLQQPYLLDGISCIMTVSIGYVSPDKNVLQNKPRQQTDEEFFIDLADKVMYHNKKEYHQGRENQESEKSGDLNQQSVSI